MLWDVASASSLFFYSGNSPCPGGPTLTTDLALATPTDCALSKDPYYYDLNPVS